MHLKKSEVQIGKESTGVSSDFNPTPPIYASSIHQKHNHHDHHLLAEIFTENSPSYESSTTPYKRPLLTQSPSSLSKSPSLYHFPTTSPHFESQDTSFCSTSIATRSAAFRIILCFKHIRRFRVHLRVILLLSLPFLYFFVSLPSHSLVLDFLSAFAFSAALLISLNLSIPRLPSIRFLLARSFRINLKLCAQSTQHLPVIWTIGSPQEQERKLNSGCWVQVYSNGDVFEGEFHKGMCSGSGVYYYNMSGRYEGDWVDGKYHGYGVETWARGSRYRGQYRQGLRHGLGVYRFYNGDVYSGEWSNGQSHGCGILTCEDGSRYVGEFKWGVKHGLGHYNFRNGDIYSGEYFADKMHGFGVYCFVNGHRYEGAWHEGRRQGPGMYTFRNAETQSGYWQNGLLHVPSTRNTTYPLSPAGFNHSKVLNALQEARRGAEKAYDVAKVDERVNRAVVAANKAANAARAASVKAKQKRMYHQDATNDENNIPFT